MITRASVPKCVAFTVSVVAVPGSGVPPGVSRLSLSVVVPAAAALTLTGMVRCWPAPMVTVAL